jgi:PAS domain-containing protein
LNWTFHTELPSPQSGNHPRGREGHWRSIRSSRGLRCHCYRPYYCAPGLPARVLAAANEGKFKGEGWRVRKDGTRFWASVIIDPIRDGAGNLIGYAKITRDLSERKAAEAMLRRSDEQFRRLVEGVTDYSIYMLGLDGRVQAGTPAQNGSRVTNLMRLSARISRGFRLRKIVKTGSPNAH